MKRKKDDNSIYFLIITLGIIIFLVILNYNRGLKPGNVLLIKSDSDILPIKFPYYFCYGGEKIDFNTKESVNMLNCPNEDPGDPRCIEHLYTDYCVNEFNLKKFHCLNGQTRGLKIVDCRKIGLTCVDGECQ